MNYLNPITAIDNSFPKQIPKPISLSLLEDDVWENVNIPTATSGSNTYGIALGESTSIFPNASGNIIQRSEKETYINTLINFNYELKKPIPVRLIREGNDIIGDIKDLELYSFGNDEFEVLKELNEEITELFEMLINIEDSNLGKFPKSWKSILTRYIQIS